MYYSENQKTVSDLDHAAEPHGAADSRSHKTGQLGCVAYEASSIFKI